MFFYFWCSGSTAALNLFFKAANDFREMNRTYDTQSPQRMIRFRPVLYQSLWKQSPMTKDVNSSFAAGL